MTTWRQLLTEAAAERGEAFEQLTVSIADGELDRPFRVGYGGTEGADFTAWGPVWAYFPLCYDGSEWVGSAPRNPCDVKMSHQGG
jgi:hypothetical protein